MHRVDGSGNVAGHWTEGDPDTGTQATEITAAIMEALQEEVIAVIAAASMALVKGNNAQLLAALQALFVKKAGDTMTGALTLSGAPTLGGHAATKTYVDSLLAGAATTAAPGIVQLSTDAETQTGTNNTHAVTPQNLNNRTANTSRTGIVELATDTETRTGTDTVRAITPSNLFSFAKSLVQNGYVTLPGSNLIIQWAKSASLPNTGLSDTINFPITFPTGCFGVWAMAVGDTAGGATGTEKHCNVLAFTTSSVDVTLYRDNGSGTDPMFVYILTIGI